MKILYIKDTFDSKQGDIKEVDDMLANVLVLTGVAEEYKQQKRQVKVKKDE